MPPTGDAKEGPSEERRELPPGAQSEEALVRRYAAERSPELRDEVVRRFMPLARSLAMRYRRQTESLDDLVQVAGLGLVKAVDRYDPSHGRGFAAFAVPTILGELRRHFRDHVWNVRLPRGLQELTMKVDDATSSLTEELGRFPTPTEIADRLGISVEDVLEALEAGHARRTLSLDAPRRTDEDDAASAVETLGDSEPGYDRVEAELASNVAGLDRARVAGAADAVRRRAHPAGDRPTSGRLADADLTHQPAGAVEAARRGPRGGSEGPGPAVDEPDRRGRRDTPRPRVYGRCSG